MGCEYVSANERHDASIRMIYKIKMIYTRGALPVRIAAKEVVHYRVKNECNISNQVAESLGR